MAESITVFANSLKDYLVDVVADSYNRNSQVQQKYNNLKLYMEPKKNSTPHFWVSIGISEACYDIESCEKVSGSLSGEDRYIVRWAGRSNIKGELKKHWAYITKTNLGNKTTVRKFSFAKSDIDDIKDVSDMVTGTGVKNSRRFVAFESNMREQASA